jgi:hypothetical protein
MLKTLKGDAMKEWLNHRGLVETTRGFELPQAA